MLIVLGLAVLAITALLVAASLRSDRLSVFVLAMHVIAFAELSAIVLALSPLRWVTRTGLLTSEAVVLVVAVAVWVRRDRPAVPLGGVVSFVRAALRDPVVVAFVLVVGALLVYEAVLVLTMPPNNWDSLNYHLTRVAMWRQHGGLYWIPNAPTDRLNEFQPGAELQLLYLFVLGGGATFSGFPQLSAELAIVAATYVTVTRLGLGLRAAACAALLFPLLSLVGLESATAQNDLVAASFPAIAAALLLVGEPAVAALAGIAVAVGVGVKLTTALVLPVLVVLALLGRRRVFVPFAAGGVVAGIAIASWSFILNLAETGHVLGHGGGRVENTMSPSLTNGLAVFWGVLYRVGDLPGWGDRLVWLLPAVGVDLALAYVVVAWLRRRLTRSGALLALGFALPFLAPAAVFVVCRLVRAGAWLTDAPMSVNTTAFPATGTMSWAINRLADEDTAGFGPFGAVLLVASVLTLLLAVRRIDARRWTLALTLPLFVALLATTSRFNPFLSRFVIVAFALEIPVLAQGLRNAGFALATLVVAATGAWLVVDHDLRRPLTAPLGHPWQLSRLSAADQTYDGRAGEALYALDNNVPPAASISALLGGDDPAFLLFGGKLTRHVTFLDPADVAQTADDASVPYVVLGNVDPSFVSEFTAPRWSVKSLGGYWTLATRT